MAKKPLLPLLYWLADLQVGRPWTVLLAVFLSLVPAAYAASRLELRTGFSELLPDDKPSVIELQRVNERLSGMSTLTVVAEGSGPDELKRFVDRMSPRLRELGPEYVSGVDDGTRVVQEFFEKNKHLYANLDDIQKLHDDVLARYDYEVGKQAGTNLELDEEDEPPKLSAATLEKRFEKKVQEAKKQARGLDGYYIGEGGKLGAILVRTPLGFADERAFELRNIISRIVEEERPAVGDPALKVYFAGHLISGAEQHAAVKDDLAHVGFWGIAGILGVTLIFFMRLRTLLAMALTIAVGCTWAFGMARLTVGYLNTATGFLVSIIAGNGINFGIIFMARYLEARRDERAPVEKAIRRAHRDTHTATLAAAGAAGIAYGSLAVTDFHGFKHFGIIGGLGMLLCWVATYTFLPAVLVITERLSPMFTQEAPRWRSRMKGYYGYPFAYAARAFPRALTVAGLVLGASCLWLTFRYFSSDPMEYDLRNVRNERLKETSTGRLSVRVDQIIGRLGQDGRAILTERLDQVKPLVEELERRRDAAPADKKPFDKVVTIFDLLPKDQEKKLELLDEMEDRLVRAKKRGLVSEADWKKIRENLPAKRTSIGIDDLPEQVARPFTEKNGTRGTVVYIVPCEGQSVYDARYLMRWADSFREVKLPDGTIIRGTGDPVIFSDMLINIGEDAPKAILLSLIGTLIVIVVAFRGNASGWLTLATLVLGVLWLVGFLDAQAIKLNFLNFVALPITIGIGADYAINVMKRRDMESGEDFYRALQQTGGAVVLCSLTTLLGYLALLLSINRAVKSFGLAAAVGEATTLIAAVLILPAFLFWRKPRGAPVSAAPPSSRTGGWQ